MRRVLLAVALAAAAAGCKTSRTSVLVTVHELPAGVAGLQAEFALDGEPARSAETFDPPAAGFPEPSTFVVLLPDGATGTLTVWASALNEAGCAVAAGSGDAILPADRLDLTLAPLASPVCPTPDAGPCADCDMKPLLRSPRQGATTGSARVASGSVPSPPLRPLFRWEPVFNADTFQIQIDDTCATPTFQTCTFPDPEVDQVLPGTETSFRPEFDLGVSLVPPVGSRYFWRLRVCDRDGLCSPWSDVRYLDVGRQPGDFDGDGFSDSIIGAQGTDSAGFDVGMAYVVHGGTSFPPDTMLRPIVPPAGADASSLFGLAVASVGDVNGDGFADAVVGMPQRDGIAVNEGTAYLYVGSPSGLGSAPAAQFSAPEHVGGGLFGVEVAGAGDVNGDGYADFAVGASYSESQPAEMDEGRVYVFHGGEPITVVPALTIDNPLAANSGAQFGLGLAIDGDVNGDGYADLAVAAPLASNGAMNEGGTFVFSGGPAGVSPTPVHIDHPQNQELAVFGRGLALGDFDGDGFADLVAAAPGEDTGAVMDDGRVYVFAGSRGGVVTTSYTSLVSPTPKTSSQYGVAVTVSDFQRDGYDDLVVGAWQYMIDVVDEGAVFVYHGAAGGVQTTPANTLNNLYDQPLSGFGAVLAAPGDMTGEGYAELAVGVHALDQVTVDTGAVAYYRGSPTGVSTMAAITYFSPTLTAADYFGAAVASLTRPAVTRSTDRSGALPPRSRAPAGPCRTGRGGRCPGTGS